MARKINERVDHILLVSIRVRARLHRWPGSGSSSSSRCCVSIRVRARLHRWQGLHVGAERARAVSIRVRARLHRWLLRTSHGAFPPSKSQSAFVRGFIDGSAISSLGHWKTTSLNPRSCAASSMAERDPVREQLHAGVSIRVRARLHRWRGGGRPRGGDELSQSAFVRGFIDGPGWPSAASASAGSQSAFVRGFIDGVVFGATMNFVPAVSIRVRARLHRWRIETVSCPVRIESLNPRSCAASSMAAATTWRIPATSRSQSAFVRGFIDGRRPLSRRRMKQIVSIRVRARLHRWPRS